MTYGRHDAQEMTNHHGYLRKNASLLLVEQNAKLTFGATSHCLVMENGSVAMTGTSEELSRDTRVRRIYLGL